MWRAAGGAIPHTALANHSSPGVEGQRNLTPPRLSSDETRLLVDRVASLLFLVVLAVTLLGFFGGLVMSAIKRDRGVKDWGHMIEGHGGMLDRMDSVCFAAPIFFHFVRYWWA